MTEGVLYIWKSFVIPQGSILGPLFFFNFVYINDLIVNLGSDVHLFADDTSLLDCFNDYAE